MLVCSALEEVQDVKPNELDRHDLASATIATIRPERQHYEHQPPLLLPLHVTPRPEGQHHQHQLRLLLPVCLTTRPTGQHHEPHPRLLVPVYFIWGAVIL